MRLVSAKGTRFRRDELLASTLACRGSSNDAGWKGSGSSDRAYCDENRVQHARLEWKVDFLPDRIVLCKITRAGDAAAKRTHLVKQAERKAENTARASASV